jgi:hypothetical protein
MCPQGERPELIRWRLCGTNGTSSFVPQRRMKNVVGIRQELVPGVGYLDESGDPIPPRCASAKGRQISDFS